MEGWQRGQSTVGLFLHNGNEYLEAMLGSYAARCAPVNLNWRSTAEELAYLLVDSGAQALVYHRSLAGVLDDALGLDRPALLLEVDDAGRRPGRRRRRRRAAAARRRALRGRAGGRVARLARRARPTTSTCSTPAAPPAGRRARCGASATSWPARSASATPSVDEVLAGAGNGARLRALPSPPLIHGAAQWNAWSAWLGGGTVVIQSVVHHFDPFDVLDTAARHRVTSLQIVGDAFGRPLLDALAAHPPDLSALRFVTSGGTALSPEVRDGLRAALPGVTILDIMGSSESGRLAVATHAAGPHRWVRAVGRRRGGGRRARRRVIARDDDTIGWLATTGPIPLGYLGDPDKTRPRSPTIDGVRYTVPGDRARWRPDGTVEVLGREASVINTGGEKVFAEEVEAALKAHPAVLDALVVGRPHPVLGSEVCAVVAVRPGTAPTLEELRSVAGEHLSRYKLPRHLVLRDAVQRSPAGKPDYGWARDQLD